MAPRFTHEDASQLRGYFSSDRVFFRSSFGAMLDHLRSDSSDSEGHRIPIPASWAWRPSRDEPVVWASAASTKRQWNSGSYEVSEEIMQNVGGAGRRLRQLSNLAYVVFGRYYGDAGAMWAAAAQDRKGARAGKDVVLFKGIGPGAIAALYIMTAAGRELIEFEKAMAEGSASTKRRTVKAEEQAAHRASIEATIAEKEVAIEALGDDRETKAMELGLLRTKEAEYRGNNTRIPTALYNRVKKTKGELQELRRAREDLRRDILRLRLQLVYVPVSADNNPTPDETSAAVLADRRRLAAIFDSELATWQDIKDDMERVCGKMADDDKRLPPRPVLDLPQLAPARIVSHRIRPQETHLSDDDRLHVAFVLDRSLAGSKEAIAKRRSLLSLASTQANAMLVSAWAEWMQSDTASYITPEPR